MLDLETSPNIAHTWGLWNVNVYGAQLIEPSRVICFSAQWYGSSKNTFYSEWGIGHNEMVNAAHNLIDEADVLLTYNGKRFDYPRLKQEMVMARIAPPSPVKHIDLFETVKSLKFPSSSLKYALGAFNLAGKDSVDHQLWVDVLNGDPKAQKKMEKYCRQDVKVMGPLYELLQPWIPNHPSYGALTGEDVCPNCGSHNLMPQGYALTASSKFRRFKCGDCGKWSRSNHKVSGTGIVQAL
jgi:hypothetical protein